MALRDVAGNAARMSAGFWNEVARAISPPPPRPTTRSDRPPSRDPRSRSDASDAPHPTSEQAAAEPEGVLVPAETWTRVLEQLGHLHEAGRELAEARERAARAETQVEFLRQQLADAKAAARPARQRASAPPRAPATRSVAPARTKPSRLAVSRARVASARNRVSTWIRVD